MKSQCRASDFMKHIACHREILIGKLALNLLFSAMLFLLFAISYSIKVLEIDVKSIMRCLPFQFSTSKSDEMNIFHFFIFICLG